MTKQEALKKLKGFDHCFLSPETAQEIAKAFNCIARTYMAKDNRSEFKGLHVPSVNEGDEVEGLDADILARQICDQLELEYTSMYGRGSRLAECCRAIEEHINK